MFSYLHFVYTRPTRGSGFNQIVSTQRAAHTNNTFLRLFGDDPRMIEMILSRVNSSVSDCRNSCITVHLVYLHNVMYDLDTQYPISFFKANRCEYISTKWKDLNSYIGVVYMVSRNSKLFI